MNTYDDPHEYGVYAMYRAMYEDESADQLVNEVRLARTRTLVNEYLVAEAEARFAKKHGLTLEQVDQVIRTGRLPQ